MSKESYTSTYLKIEISHSYYLFTQVLLTKIDFNLLQTKFLYQSNNKNKLKLNWKLICSLLLWANKEYKANKSIYIYISISNPQDKY